MEAATLLVNAGGSLAAVLGVYVRSRASLHLDGGGVLSPPGDAGGAAGGAGGGVWGHVCPRGGVRSVPPSLRRRRGAARGGAAGEDVAVLVADVAIGDQADAQVGRRLARGGEKVVHEGVGFEGEDARRRLNRNRGEIAQEEGQGRQQAFPRGAALGRDEQPCRGRFAYHTFPAPGV